MSFKFVVRHLFFTLLWYFRIHFTLYFVSHEILSLRCSRIIMFTDCARLAEWIGYCWCTQLTSARNNNNEMLHKILNWCHELNGKTLFVIESRMELNNHSVWFGLVWFLAQTFCHITQYLIAHGEWGMEIGKDWTHCSRDYSIAKPQIESLNGWIFKWGFSTVNTLTLTSSLAEW